MKFTVATEGPPVKPEAPIRSAQAILAALKATHPEVVGVQCSNDDIEVITDRELSPEKQAAVKALATAIA